MTNHIRKPSWDKRATPKYLVRKCPSRKLYHETAKPKIDNKNPSYTIHQIAFFANILVQIKMLRKRNQLK